MLESWLRTRRPIVLAAIVALAVIVRVVAFVQVNGGPCLSLHRWDATDMHFFDEWARTIAAGDWLTDEPLHPFHPWAHEVVDKYLAVHPEVAETLPGKEHEGRAITLWNRWNGGKTFHQEPLYAYLLAGIYRLLGPDVRWVFAVQLAAGVGMTVLLYLTVCRQLGDTVAVVAALLVTLAGPLVYHELLLLRESLVTAAGIALVFLTDRARDGRRWTAWLALGVALGVAMLLKTIFLVYGVGVLAVLAITRRTRALAPAAALLAGLTLALSPAVARNLAVGVPPLALSSVGGLVFLESNAVDFRPGVGFVVSEQTPTIMGATGGRFWPTVSLTLETHPDRWSVLRMLGGKMRTLWHWYEMPNNSNFYFFRLHAPVLHLLPVTFFVLSPLGLVGLGLGLRWLSRAWPLYLMVACHVTHLLVFYTLSRLRIPLLPALAPFAALTLVELGRSLATGRIVWAAAVAGAALALGTWTGRPLPPGVTLVGAVDYWAAYQTYYKPLIDEAQRDGDEGRAADVFRASLAFEPAEVRGVDAAHPAAAGSTADLVTLFASVHEAFAEELARGGQAEEAQREAERARELKAALREHTT